jgi:hypothetical protein
MQNSYCDHRNFDSVYQALGMNLHTAAGGDTVITVVGYYLFRFSELFEGPSKKILNPTQGSNP